jgi:hypothetical protein
MDTYAENYDPDATADNGSCSGYPDNGDHSLSFNGNGDYVSVQSEEFDNLFSGYNPFTVSLWIYGNSGGNDNTYGELFDKGNTPNSAGQNPSSVMLLKQSDGSVTFLLYSGNSDFIYVDAPAAAEILDAENWNHITAVYDGGTESNSLKLYKNGSVFENVTNGGNGSYTGIRSSENQPFPPLVTFSNTDPFLYSFKLFDSVPPS